ncbi:late cornified envelope protein 6A [Mustela erminea]|uniref:late cornified envelope protein 6A n=1 Tax=Mustela erminea TaxID=36723 RepID=UPI0013874C3E|nr:late cornified envelope protein 6A [Mustela erminea]
MSRQKQESWEPPSAPKCSPRQCSNTSLAPCSAPCCDLCSGGYNSGSQKPGEQSPGGSQRAHRKKPRCLSGGTVYHIKEEEC